MYLCKLYSRAFSSFRSGLSKVIYKLSAKYRHTELKNELMADVLFEKKLVRKPK